MHFRRSPVLPLANGNPGTKSDRTEKIDQNGIAPPATPINVDNGNGGYATGLLQGAKPIVPELNFSGLTKRTYWHDRRSGGVEPAAVVAQTCKAGLIGALLLLITTPAKTAVASANDNMHAVAIL
ncbi:MAG: hypothetical protein ACI9UN_005334 [Granulosicoccus sp.]|jgi:hypothetical protein